MAVCVLIPAYEPEERFAEYAALCAQRGPRAVWFVIADFGRVYRFGY